MLRLLWQIFPSNVQDYVIIRQQERSDFLAFGVLHNVSLLRQYVPPSLLLISLLLSKINNFTCGLPFALLGNANHWLFHCPLLGDEGAVG
jgi:hypothetical protein